MRGDRVQSIFRIMGGGRGEQGKGGSCIGACILGIARKRNVTIRERGSERERERARARKVDVFDTKRARIKRKDNNG